MASRRAQSGFTLFEVMAATMVSASVLLPALALLFATIEWHDQTSGRIALNRQARAIFDVLSEGAIRNEAGLDGTSYVYGIHGRRQAPGSGMRANYVLDFRSNGITVNSDSFAEMTVPCEDDEKPLPTCTPGGADQTVAGWLSRDVAVDADSRSVANRTAEVTLTLTDPFRAQRLENPAEATETYRGVFTLNRDESDP